MSLPMLHQSDGRSPSKHHQAPPSARCTGRSLRSLRPGDGRDWAWPDPDGLDANADDKLSPATLEKLVLRLKGALIGETIVESTWKGSYSGYFQKLIEVAGQQRWQSAPDLLEQTLRTWEPNSRSRQIGHDRLRRLWREAGWDWPDAINKMRGNGKAAAPTKESERSLTWKSRNSGRALNGASSALRLRWPGIYWQRLASAPPN